jgi:hypothetical protein
MREKTLINELHRVDLRFIKERERGECHIVNTEALLSSGKESETLWIVV